MNKSTLILAFTVTAVSSSVACSLLLDHASDQCKTNADCAQFGPGTVCSQSVCVPPGSSSSATTMSSTTGSGGGAMDGGVDGAGGPDGCFPGQPTTPDELLNACSFSQC